MEKSVVIPNKLGINVWGQMSQGRSRPEEPILPVIIWKMPEFYILVWLYFIWIFKKVICRSIESLAHKVSSLSYLYAREIHDPLYFS